MRFESLAHAVPGDGYFELGIFSQQQEASFAAGDGESRVDHGG